MVGESEIRRRKKCSWLLTVRQFITIHNNNNNNNKNNNNNNNKNVDDDKIITIIIIVIITSIIMHSYDNKHNINYKINDSNVKT